MATTMNNPASLPQTIASAIGRGKSRKEVVKILVNSGINPPEAESLVNYAVSTHKAEIRKGAAKQLGVGILLLVIGIVITAATYSMASRGGIYVVAYGPIVFGAISILRGLFRFVFA
jgi:uncharacterized membrane protein